MQENLQRLSLIRPVKLRLERPLGGPYASVLRRPPPEIEALETGSCLVLLRTRRLDQPLPLVSSLATPYYGGRGCPVNAADFRDPVQAAHSLSHPEEGQVRLLAVPAGNAELPNMAWVSQLAAELSPWCAEVVEAWRRRLKVPRLWLNIVRVHTADPVRIRLPRGKTPPPRIRPFRMAQLKAVMPEGEFAARVESLLQQVVQHSSPPPSMAARPHPQAPAPERLEGPSWEVELPPEWEVRLRRKKQVILCGPPGTGKTYLARRLAR